MVRIPWLLPLLLIVLLGGSEEAVAGREEPGPGRPVWPKPGQLDHQLYDKAMRIQSRMWWHLSPEGLLAEIHRPGATYAELSHDVLGLNDAAIWTGCYAAAQAARWHVTKDPDALAQVRHLAQGLANLTNVTGIPGCLVRNLGRPLPGAPTPRDTFPSKSMDGLRFKSDVSRDQLAGVTLGWWAMARWVDDSELRRLAQEQMLGIAKRLTKAGMWLVDHRGQRTKHGEMRADVEHVPFVKNGPLASIGLATILLAQDLNPDVKWLTRAVFELGKQGWDRALSDQLTFAKFTVSSSNANMTTLALTSLAHSRHGNTKHRARMGMRAIRKATVGWWNAGLCSCSLLAKSGWNGRELLGEIRATLHAMPETGEIPAKFQQWHERKIVPIQHRSILSGWAWKESTTLYVHPEPGSGPSTKRTHTRADWLFAYWLTRAAGYLHPKAGPGANPHAHCTMQYPPWMATGRR